MKKKPMAGLMAALLVTGVVGCSSTQSNDKKMDAKQTGSNKMNMTDEQMKNMKSNDKK